MSAMVAQCLLLDVLEMSSDGSTRFGRENYRGLCFEVLLVRSLG